MSDKVTPVEKTAPAMTPEAFAKKHGGDSRSRRAYIEGRVKAVKGNDFTAIADEFASTPAKHREMLRDLGHKAEDSE